MRKFAHFCILPLIASGAITGPVNASPQIGATSATANAAFDWTMTPHVTGVEVSATPSQIDFTTDQAGGTCGAGALLYWYPSHHASDATSQAQNASAVISVLMTAEATGRGVLLYGSNANCEIDFIYLK